jgi:hypothetical protein
VKGADIWGNFLHQSTAFNTEQRKGPRKGKERKPENHGPKLIHCQDVEFLLADKCSLVLLSFSRPKNLAVVDGKLKRDWQMQSII